MRRLALLCLVVLCCGIGPGARAADDPYTVSGITVDASAASAVQARTIAINAGRTRAWTVLYRRLAKQEDWAKQPALDDATLQRLVRSYLASNERRSTTRFVASMTYVFNSGAVRRVLRQANIVYAEAEARPILVIPMSPFYGPHTAWTGIWSTARFAHGSVPLLTPLGDAVDAEHLAPLNFATASWQDVEPAASRVHAAEAFLVLAQAGKGQVTVKIRRLGPGASPALPDVTTPSPPTVPAPAIYETAADSTAAVIIDAWKARSAVDYSKKAKLVADVYVDSMAGWGALLQKLGGVPTVTDVSVLAMDIGEARLAITYVGSPELLKDNLSRGGLVLTNQAGSWQLARQAASGSPQ